MASEVYGEGVPRERQIELEPFEGDRSTVSLWIDYNRKSVGIGELIDFSQAMIK